MKKRTRMAKLGLVAAVAAAAIWGILQWPAEIPDANSPPEGNHAGAINSGTSLGQTFVASRNGINRVDVTLSVEHPIEQKTLTFQIMEVPWKQVREVTQPLTAFPVGKVGDFRPGTIMERWYAFQFDPIPDSAGKELYFSLDSKDLPEANSVSLLMFFHNEYPSGEAYINGEPVNAHVVFRAYAEGHLVDLIGALTANLIKDGPGLLGSPLTYAGLGLIYLLLAAGVIFIAKKAT